MDPKVFDAILEEVAAGEGVTKGLKARKLSQRSFWGHIAQDPAAADAYAQARVRGLDRISEDALDIADDGALAPDDRRIRVDTRKWLLSKLAPKKYGDKLGLTDGEGKPLNINVTLPWQDKTQE